MKAQRKGTNDTTQAKLADHKSRMDRLMSEGFSKNEASRRALLEMQIASTMKREPRKGFELP